MPVQAFLVAAGQGLVLGPEEETEALALPGCSQSDGGKAEGAPPQHLYIEFATLRASQLQPMVQ
jgi:hypothetical protein